MKIIIWNAYESCPAPTMFLLTVLPQSCLKASESFFFPVCIVEPIQNPSTTMMFLRRREPHCEEKKV